MPIDPVTGSLIGAGSSLLGGLLGGGDTGPSIDDIIRDLSGPKGIGLGYLERLAPDLFDGVARNKRGKLKGRPDISFGANRGLSLAGLLGFQDGINNDIIPFIEGAGGALSDGFRNRSTQLLDRIGDNTGDLRSFLGDGLGLLRDQFDQVVSRAGADASASKAAIEQAFQDTVREGSNDIDSALTARGFGGSTLQESSVINDLLPQAIGGKLNALASLENAKNSRITSAGLAGAGAFGSFLSQTNSILANRANAADQVAFQLFGGGEQLDQRLFNQILGAKLSGNQFTGSILAQPSQIFIDPNVRNPFSYSSTGGASPSTLQQFGGTLAGIGGSILGESLGNLFGG